MSFLFSAGSGTCAESRFRQVADEYEETGLSHRSLDAGLDISGISGDSAGVRDWKYFDIGVSVRPSLIKRRGRLNFHSSPWWTLSVESGEIDTLSESDFEMTYRKTGLVTGAGYGLRFESELKDLFFTGIEASVRTGVSSLFTQEIDEINMYLPDEWKKDLTENRFLRAEGVLNTVPVAGIRGESKELIPVIQAFEIEERLIENGLIDFQLSDETIVSIANFFAGNEDESIKDDSIVAVLKRGLDTILSSDMALDTANIGKLSLFDIKRVLKLRDYGEYLWDSSLFLRLHNRFEGIWEYAVTEYPFDTLRETSRSTSLDGPEYDYVLEIRGELTRPAAEWCFFQAGFSRNLYSKEKGFLDSESYGVSDILTNTLFFSALFRAGYTLSLQVGCERLPAWVLIPNDLPGQVYGDIGLKIEDYFKIRVSGVYVFREGRYPQSGEAYQRGIQPEAAQQGVSAIFPAKGFKLNFNVISGF